MSPIRWPVLISNPKQARSIVPIAQRLRNVSISASSNGRWPSPSDFGSFGLAAVGALRVCGERLAFGRRSILPAGRIGCYPQENRRGVILSFDRDATYGNDCNRRQQSVWGMK
jgi:hypothetical protein